MLLRRYVVVADDDRPVGDVGEVRDCARKIEERAVAGGVERPLRSGTRIDHTS